MKQQTITTSAWLTAALAVTGTTLAATDTSTLTVQVTIVATCEVQDATMTFSNPGTLTSPVTSGAVNVPIKCTNGQTYKVGFGTGQNFLNNTRRMRRGTSADYITCGIYKNAGLTNALPNPIFTDPNTYIAGTGNGSTQNVPIYGRIPVQDAPTAGIYTDTVLVTVDY